MPFENFFRYIEGQGHSGQINVQMVINGAYPGHNLYIYAWNSK